MSQQKDFEADEAEKALEAPEIIIENDDDEAEKEVEAKEKTSNEEISVEDGLEKLKRELEDERKRSEKLAAEKRRAEEAAAKTRSELDETNALLLDNAIEKMRGEISNTKLRIKEALETGDYAEAADLQDSLAKHNNTLSKLELGKQQHTERTKQPQINDPVEAFASRLTPASAEWIRKHPQCVTDARLNQKMIAAHNLALADGIQADTDEYFASIEATLKLRNEPAVQRRDDPPAKNTRELEDQDDDPMSQAAKPVRTRQPTSPPAAPVSRSGSSGNSPTRIRLTAQEREMASMMGMSEMDYAKNKAQLIKEGKLAS